MAGTRKSIDGYVGNRVPGKSLSPSARDSVEPLQRDTAAQKTRRSKDSELPCDCDKMLLEVLEQQRKRLGDSLHDTISQQITALSLLSSNLRRELAAHHSPLAGKAARIVDGLNETSAYLREMTRELLPAPINGRNLRSELEKLAERVTDQGAQCHLTASDPIPELADHFATQLYFIAQEAVLNAARHARADRIDVLLRANGGAIEIEIRDNGVEFDTQSVSESVGLEIMRYRARAIDAEITIDARPGRGTLMRCRARLPI